MAVDNGWRKLTGSVLDSKKVLSMTSECFLIEDGSVWCADPPETPQVGQCNWNTDLEPQGSGACSYPKSVVTLQQVIGLPLPAVSLGDDDLFKQSTRSTRVPYGNGYASWTTYGVGAAAGMMAYTTAAVVVRAPSCQIHLQTH